MAILVDQRTRLVVQGLTGREGRFHALRNRDYGTNLVAQGILDALDRLGDKVKVPLVVRLDGTNPEEGRALLAGSPSDQVIPAATMLDAARKAVELADPKAGA